MFESRVQACNDESSVSIISLCSIPCVIRLYVYCSSLPSVARPIQVCSRNGEVRERVHAGLPWRWQTAHSDAQLHPAHQPGLPSGPVLLEGSGARGSVGAGAVRGVADGGVLQATAGELSGLQHPQTERKPRVWTRVSLHGVLQKLRLEVLGGKVSTSTNQKWCYGVGFILVLFIYCYNCIHTLN